jgi:hypothetical protein
MSAQCGVAPASDVLSAHVATGIGAHDAPEWVPTMNRNECPRCAGIRKKNADPVLIVGDDKSVWSPSCDEKERRA